jgi:hypothetical protein
MSIQIAVDIPEPQAEAPRALFDPANAKILVGYRDHGTEKKTLHPSIVSIVDIYGTDLKKIETIHESASIKDIRELSANPGTIFSYKSYFSQDGSTIFDGLNRTAISGTNLVKTYVNPLEKLTPQQLAALKQFQKRDPSSQQPWFDFSPGDSAAGRTVVRISDYKRGQAAYWTVDLRTGEASPIIVGPFGTDHLSPDGKTLLIQAAEATGGATPQISMRSMFFVYDVAQGKQIGQFENAALGGIDFGQETICIAPSSDRMFATSKEGTIFLLGLPNGSEISRLHLRSVDRFSGGCVFAKE